MLRFARLILFNFYPKIWNVISLIFYFYSNRLICNSPYFLLFSVTMSFCFCFLPLSFSTNNF
ncbi:hypothetical protein CJ209_01705 [Fusobacterium nucleatum]|uniref:Uncharacterized protein n=1 Tax=Fusobacterium nucleatum TaxID=851 RepID=A0A2N6TNZ6_FUSNU|nr:hypothetical protein CJ209_01705 [Fusobacterium nucleatum]